MFKVVLSAIFIFNMLASVVMIKQVGGHMDGMVRDGRLTRWLKQWAIIVISVEGGVSLLSFLAFKEEQIVLFGVDYHMILLALYAAAMANVWAWVFVFHQKKWDANGRTGESEVQGSVE